MFPGISISPLVPIVPIVPNVLDHLRGPIEQVGGQIRDAVVDNAPHVAEVGEAVLHSDVRGLTAQEREIAEEYFGDKIDLDRVTINENSVLSAANGFFPGNSNSRPFVVGNTINFPNGLDLSSAGQRGTFIHELAHVWQFQTTHGIQVQIQGAQLASDPSNYDIDTSQLDDPQNFHDFNIEQQAEVVQGYYLLQRHEELIAQRDSLVTAPPQVQLDVLPGINADIRQIEGKGAFQDLTAAGIAVNDLQPFIDLIQDTPPREGIVAEFEEGLDEFLASGFNPLEITEGGLEVGREVGEAGIREAGEFAVDRFNDGRDAVNTVGDAFSWVSSRLF